jgi:hypothetical protein
LAVAPQTSDLGKSLPRLTQLVRWSDLHLAYRIRTLIFSDRGLVGLTSRSVGFAISDLAAPALQREEGKATTENVLRRCRGTAVREFGVVHLQIVSSFLLGGLVFPAGT